MSRLLPPAARSAPALRRLFLSVVRLVGQRSADGEDLERRQVGAGTPVHAHPLLRAVAQDVDLGPSPVLQHADGHHLAGQRLGADLQVIALGNHEHALERQTGARLGGQAVDQDAVARGHPVLLTTTDDDSRQRSA